MTVLVPLAPPTTPISLATVVRISKLVFLRAVLKLPVAVLKLPVAVLKLPVAVLKLPVAVLNLTSP